MNTKVKKKVPEIFLFILQFLGYNISIITNVIYVQEALFITPKPILS